MPSLVVSKVRDYKGPFEVNRGQFLKISADKRKHTQQITALKNQIKGEQEYSDEQEALLGLVTEHVSCSEQNRTLFEEHFFCSHRL